MKREPKKRKVSEDFPVSRSLRFVRSALEMSVQSLKVYSSSQFNFVSL